MEMPPRLIAGRYEIEREVGRGGMGVVYRARDTRLGRTVALKMLPAEVAADAELGRRLAIEARAASALNHPGIATVYDYEEHPEGRFIVYEFVEGDSLRKHCAVFSHARFPLDALLGIAIQIADAVAAAHDRGIIHRDLKPENILLVEGADPMARIKILDFGLAKVRRPHSASAGGDSAETETVHTTPGLQVGTVNYMSPEQVEGEPADARSDIFGLGVVLYELASGKNPFVGRSRASTEAKILRDDAPSLALPDTAVPSELDRILRKCLRKRPEERYQSAAELRVDLSNLRRDAAAGAAQAAPPWAAKARRPDAPINVPRGIGRALLMSVQAGYLAMYGVFIYQVSKPFEMHGAGGTLLSQNQMANLILILFFAALAGTPVRLYILSAVAFDYPDFGRKYRKLAPAAMVLDLVWAGAPLLLGPRVGPLALLFVGGLAYLPLAQRRLIFDAYSPEGGRTSGVRISE